MPAIAWELLVTAGSTRIAVARMPMAPLCSVIIGKCHVKGDIWEREAFEHFCSSSRIKRMGSLVDDRFR